MDPRTLKNPKALYQFKEGFQKVNTKFVEIFGVSLPELKSLPKERRDEILSAGAGDCGKQFEEYMIKTFESLGLRASYDIGVSEEKLKAILVEIELLKRERHTLRGRSKRHKRNAVNKKFRRKLVELEQVLIEANTGKISYGKESQIAEICSNKLMRKNFKSVRDCSSCGKVMENWKGCPCKKSWYCNRKW